MNQLGIEIASVGFSAHNQVLRDMDAHVTTYESQLTAISGLKYRLEKMYSLPEIFLCGTGIDLVNYDHLLEFIKKRELGIPVVVYDQALNIGRKTMAMALGAAAYLADPIADEVFEKTLKTTIKTAEVRKSSFWNLIHR